MKNRSIRTILSTYFIILATAIFLGVSVIYMFLQYRTLRRQAEESLAAVSGGTAVSLRQGIREMDTILLYSIASDEMKSAL